MRTTGVLWKQEEKALKIEVDPEGREIMDPFDTSAPGTLWGQSGDTYKGVSLIANPLFYK